MPRRGGNTRRHARQRRRGNFGRSHGRSHSHVNDKPITQAKRHRRRKQPDIDIYLDDWNLE